MLCLISIGGCRYAAPFFLAMGPAGQPAEQDGGFTMKVFDFHSRMAMGPVIGQAEQDGGKNYAFLRKTIHKENQRCNLDS